MNDSELENDGISRSGQQTNASPASSHGNAPPNRSGCRKGNRAAYAQPHMRQAPARKTRSTRRQRCVRLSTTRYLVSARPQSSLSDPLAAPACTQPLFSLVNSRDMPWHEHPSPPSCATAMQSPAQVTCVSVQKSRSALCLAHMTVREIANTRYTANATTYKSAPRDLVCETHYSATFLFTFFGCLALGLLTHSVCRNSSDSYWYAAFHCPPDLTSRDTDTVPCYFR